MPKFSTIVVFNVFCKFVSKKYKNSFFNIVTMFIQYTSFCFFICIQSVLVSNTIEVFNLLNKKISKTQALDQKETNEFISQLYTIAYSNPDSLQLIPQCVYLEASSNYVQSNNDSTLLPKVKATLNMLDSASYPREFALSQLSLGLLYTMQGDYVEAFIASSRAMEYFKTLNDTVFITKTLILLGDIYTYIRSFKLSENYFRRAALLTKPEQQEYNQILYGRARIHFSLQQTDSVVPILLKIISLSKQQEDMFWLTNGYLSMGVCYHMKNMPDSAYNCYMTALNMSKEVNNKRVYFSLYQNLATYHAAYSNDFQNAVYYYRLAKREAADNNNIDQLAYVYYGLAKTFELFNCIDSAYFYLNLYNDLKDGLSSNAKTIETYRAYISLMLASSDKELEITKQLVTSKNRQIWFVVFLSIAVALLLVFLLAIMKQKQNAVILQVEQDKEIQRLQDEKIDSQSRELVSHALHLSQKNDILQKIYTHTNTMLNEGGVKEIQQILKNNLSVDRAWETFMLHFNRVHPNFFERLKLMTPGLTENNLRLCAYFRVGLSTKDIAQILSTTADTIKRSRNRMKNKIGLRDVDSLDDFLRSI